MGSMAFRAGVTVTHLLVGQALGTRSHHVVLADGLQHAVAGQQHGSGEGYEREGSDGQHHVFRDVQRQPADA